MSTPTFTMFHADCVGNAVNCLYSHKVEIADADTFRQAVRFDHVYAAYRDNYRSVGNFISANALPSRPTRNPTNRRSRSKTTRPNGQFSRVCMRPSSSRKCTIRYRKSVMDAGGRPQWVKCQRSPAWSTVPIAATSCIKSGAAACHRVSTWYAPPTAKREKAYARHIKSAIRSSCSFCLRTYSG